MADEFEKWLLAKQNALRAVMGLKAITRVDYLHKSVNDFKECWDAALASEAVEIHKQRTEYIASQQQPRVISISSIDGLLPCPFCAGQYVNKSMAPYTSQPKLEQLAEDCGGGWRVICYGCLVETSEKRATKNEAVETWNRRLLHQQPQGDTCKAEPKHPMWALQDKGCDGNCRGESHQVCLLCHHAQVLAAKEAEIAKLKEIDAIRVYNLEVAQSRIAQIEDEYKCLLDHHHSDQRVIADLQKTIEEKQERIWELEQRFHHIYNDCGHDPRVCAKCGLDVNDGVHFKSASPQAGERGEESK